MTTAANGDRTIAKLLSIALIGTYLAAYKQPSFPALFRQSIRCDSLRCQWRTRAWHAIHELCFLASPKFPNCQSLPDFEASQLGAQFTAIQQFALQGPDQRVSTPLDLNGSLYVAKVIDFQPASNGQYGDPDVQEKLRRMIDEVLTREFLNDAQERAKLRTEVWVSQRLR